MKVAADSPARVAFPKRLQRISFAQCRQTNDGPRATGAKWRRLIFSASAFQAARASWQLNRFFFVLFLDKNLSLRCFWLRSIVLLLIYKEFGRVVYVHRVCNNSPNIKWTFISFIDGWHSDPVDGSSHKYIFIPPGKLSLLAFMLQHNLTFASAFLSHQLLLQCSADMPSASFELRVRRDVLLQP